MIINTLAIIKTILAVSIVLNVFVIGLDSDLQSTVFLFKKPVKLVRSLLSMFVFFPAIVFVSLSTFVLDPAVKIALMSLAVSPIPPLLPKKELKAGGNISYTIGLLSATTLLSIVIVPAVLYMVGWILEKNIRIPMFSIVKIIMVTIALPLLSGMLIKHILPDFPQRTLRLLSITAQLLLWGCVISIVYTAWPAIATLVGNWSFMSIVIFIIAGFFLGYFIGGPDPQERTVLGFSTAFRHPGIAIAIASINYPEQILVPAAVLLYLIAGAVVSIPIIAWKRLSR